MDCSVGHGGGADVLVELVLAVSRSRGHGSSGIALQNNSINSTKFRKWLQQVIQNVLKN
jgi:hypothetical protein